MSKWYRVLKLEYQFPYKQTEHYKTIINVYISKLVQCLMNKNFKNY